MTDAIHLQTPLKDQDVERLTVGDRVLINGVVYAARDVAHQRMAETLQRGDDLPFDVRGQILYYVGPSPEPPGQVIGAAGPTTASRMDQFTPMLLQLGLKGMIGKGQRSAPVLKSLMENRAVYFVAVGGAAALLSEQIRESRIIAYDDLGPEALRRLVLEDFPAIVANDVHGNDLFRAGWKRYRRDKKKR